MVQLGLGQPIDSLAGLTVDRYGCTGLLSTLGWICNFYYNQAPARRKLISRSRLPRRTIVRPVRLREVHPLGIPTPSAVGLHSHWGATSFKSHSSWIQKFATHRAKHVHKSKVVQLVVFARKTDRQRSGARGGAGGPF